MLIGPRPSRRCQERDELGDCWSTLRDLSGYEGKDASPYKLPSNLYVRPLPKRQLEKNLTAFSLVLSKSIFLITKKAWKTSPYRPIRLSPQLALQPHHPFSRGTSDGSRVKLSGRVLLTSLTHSRIGGRIARPLTSFCMPGRPSK